MINKRVFLIVIFLIGIIAISAVSAADEDIAVDAMDGEITVNDDNLGIGERSNILEDSKNNEINAKNNTLGASDSALGVGDNTLGVGDSALGVGDGALGVGDGALGASDSALGVGDNVLGAKDDGTFTSLQKLINSAKSGSTINLENDYNYNNGFAIEGIFINKPLTINGNGHTLNGLKKAHIFYVNSSDVTLKNINFINGNASDPNSTNKINGFHYEMGSAIQWFGARGVLSNCRFENNFCTWDGGAIYWNDANGSISNCFFKNNMAGYGGAIKCEGGVNLTLTNSVFVENKASQMGGALSWYGKHSGLIRNCTFESNYADWGGAIAVHGDNVKLLNSTFIENIAGNSSSGRGGAIWWYGDNGLAESLIFKNNSACCGGAIFADVLLETDKPTVFRKCTFETNHGFETGGAIHVWGNCTITDSVFKKNNLYNNDGKGGAIFWDSENATINNNVFMDNNAPP